MTRILINIHSSIALPIVEGSLNFVANKNPEAIARMQIDVKSKKIPKEI